MELKEAIELCKQCESPLTPQWEMVLDLAEKVLEMQGQMPLKVEGDEIDANSPCDVQHLVSTNHAIDQCTLATAGMLAEKDQKIAELASLCGGASIAVELFDATTPAQIEWRKKWLEKYKEIL